MGPNVYRALGVKHIPSADRPRERLEALGPQALQSRELLAIVLGSGGRQQSVMELADALLRDDGLQGLASRGVHELCELPGLGPAKACQVKAALELGLRVAAKLPSARPVVSSPDQAAALLMGEMRYLDRESFRAMLLDTKNHLVEITQVSLGGLDSSHAHPREAFKRAVIRSAASVIFAHNHPSGDPEPSQADMALTRRLAEAGDVLGIGVLDHVIIGDNRFVSIRERGGL